MLHAPVREPRAGSGPVLDSIAVYPRGPTHTGPEEEHVNNTAGWASSIMRPKFRKMLEEAATGPEND